MIKREGQTRVDDEYGTLGDLNLPQIRSTLFDFDRADISKVAIGRKDHQILRIVKIENELLKIADAGGADLEDPGVVRVIRKKNTNGILTCSHVTA